MGPAHRVIAVLSGVVGVGALATTVLWDGGMLGLVIAPVFFANAGARLQLARRARA